MVWIGEMKEALPEAKATALSPSASTHTRIAAFRAVKAIGSERDDEHIREAFLNEGTVLQRQWLAELLRDTVPSVDTNGWLLACLENCAQREQHYLDHLSDAISKYVQAADIELLPQLISGTDALLDQPPLIKQGRYPVSEKFGWLLVPGSEAVERLVQERHPAALEDGALGIAHKCATSQDHGTYEIKDAGNQFSKLVPKWPDFNRATFWHGVEQARAARDERIDDFWPALAFGKFWQFGEDDFDYVTDQITSQSNMDNKLVALSLAFQLYKDCGRPRRRREKLKRLVAGNDELAHRLETYLKPPAMDDAERRYRRESARLERRAEREKGKQRKNHDDWKEFLAENLEELRQPNLPEPHGISNAQYYLLQQMPKENSAGRRTDGNWQLLLGEYGETVARAFRDGAVSHWRRNRPKLRSEGAPPNQTLYTDVFGLTGLGIEARETANWPAGLNENDIDLACRHATHELNGFPTWFPNLFEENRRQVGDFLLTEILYELSIERPDVDTHYLLSNVNWSGEWAWDTLAPKLIEYLNEHEPVNLSNLRKLLKIVQGSSVADEALNVLAAEKCRSLGDHEHLAIWYAVWTGMDPAAATPSFSNRIENITGSKDQTAFAMNYVTHLYGKRRNELPLTRPAFQTPEHLKTLHLLMHKYIRWEEDIDRLGTGVYSPGLRDHAQHARNGLYSMLVGIPGKEAFLALREISEVHPETGLRSWMAHQANGKAAQDADLAPWSPSQVREFHEELERTPANHNELHELAVMRLLDLKDDLENGDSSIAQTLRKVQDETAMRTFVGRELREKAFCRYSIPQEEELADAKRPDLRFHGNGFDGPVPVELKLAENWTGPQLFERLESQLCGDYLRDVRSRRGILVLVYGGHRDHWETPSAERVDFEGLTTALRSHWEEICPNFPGVDEVSVIGIDLTTRAAT